MCGIAGYISLNNSFSKEQLETALSSIQHRGPDAEGMYFSPDGKIGLGHRRLSILDLSAGANQPMFSSNGRYCIVFNGEIYNFNELKERLADKGASLKTTSDTEVLVELFAQHGPTIFASMNGMFAFVIYDVQQKEITICRDHIGIKPLFIFQDETTIVFASELKAIKALLGKKLSVNKAAVPYFLHLGFIPQPLTIYNNTTKFPSAHYAQICLEKTEQHKLFFDLVKFWQPETLLNNTKKNDEPAAKRQLNNLLTDAVQKQLISDVPIGTFLSGGIDSSLVTAIAAKISGAGKIKTFSIAIDEGKYNESKYAAQVAAHLNTDHHEFKVKEKEVIDLVDKLIPAYDEPFADSSAFPTMMVSRLARQHVTVALTGDGGDELFHGYGMYQWANRLSMPQWHLLKRPLFNASRLLNSKYQRIGNMFGYENRQHIITHIFSQEQYFFREQELSALLVNTNFNFDGINSLPPEAANLSEAERQSYWDLNNYLKDDLLVKVDRASMQYSLEARVPLLDYRLVEFALGLDEKWKNNNGTMKYLLKEVLFDYVPKELYNRPKWGFSIPLATWLKTDLKFLLDKYTSEAVIGKYSIVNYMVVNNLKKKYLGGTDYLFNRLWLIIVLHWWLEENNN
ncbi:asparagine synthase (glutamine-hydrolyzing) [Ferruginibacter paludis]|uniref:asparagine synthase (glutamine-hydrolyzing) n=1 Tax=Ferruginibacter paludis TaxID=1310417 RepID=UPI0025B2BBDC|nr:asparagine synthase (glutamine-hydrolyzing) [Ferruginibacter paludis]MDN3658345.1 asparagine synthase (glutamine-hydrolyzing) [Ferruginibacter paludis]